MDAGLLRGLKAAGNPHRLRLLWRILHATSPVRQHDLVRQSALPQHLACRYLQILTQAGLIQRLRRGLPVHYRPARPHSAALRRLLALVRKLPPDSFDADADGA